MDPFGDGKGQNDVELFFYLRLYLMFQTKLRKRSRIEKLEIENFEQFWKTNNFERNIKHIFLKTKNK